MFNAVQCFGLLLAVDASAAGLAPASAAAGACSPTAAEPDAGDAELAEAAEASVQLLQQALRLTRGPAGAASSSRPVRPMAELLVNASTRVIDSLPGVRLASKEQHGNSTSRSAVHEGLLLEVASTSPTHFFTLYTTLVKYILLAFLIVVLCTLTCYTGHMNDRRFAEFDEEPTPKVERSCCGLCPCRVYPEPMQADLESWEKSGKELFGQCPSWLHLPKDLGPRQWTWRIAEINLWIQIFISGNLVYESYEAPRAVLKSLQLALAVLMLLAAISAASWVHTRSRNILIHYFFFTLVTKAFYISAKYAVLSSFTTACALAQVSFSGCLPDGPLAFCLGTNSCLQEALDGSACKAPGADTCRSLSRYMPAGQDIFVYDALELFFFLMGTVPVFMAATARESVAGSMPMG
mmetsp:Transcript_45501/g.131790  ORF Transcript_45501/g.131790 Transcript_45501/m.131790 type:complete len:408 (-) Transcript_45501:179-1402(-)